MKEKLRCLYVGNFGPEFSTENDVRKAWEHLGHEVIQAQENELNWDQLFSYDYDLLLVTGTWQNVAPLEQWLDLYKGCADRGIPTCTLHLDTFWGTSRGGRHWWHEPMFHTAYIFTADGDYQDKWKALGKNHYWLPPGVRHDACHAGNYREEYACDLALVGSNGDGYHEAEWPYRKELVAALKEMALRNEWSFRNPGGEPERFDAGKIPRDDSMNDFYSSAKVTVGDSLCLKKEQSKYFSDRAIECPARYGFLIMPQIDSLSEIYQGELPMYPWGDFDMLEAMIKDYLADPKLVAQVKAKTFKIAKNNTYVNRVQTILETVGL